MGKGAPSRTYFIRSAGRVFPLKAIVNLAYQLKRESHPNYHSNTYARWFQNEFDIVHLGQQTELKRLKRQREIAERWARPKRAKFRTALLDFYSGACVISGCTCEDAIDAAHIVGVDGDGEDKVTNGLILRADLHRFFDADMLAVEPLSGQVHLHPRVRAIIVTTTCIRSSFRRQGRN